jgi:hypothetical protein
MLLQDPVLREDFARTAAARQLLVYKKDVQRDGPPEQLPFRPLWPDGRRQHARLIQWPTD